MSLGIRLLADLSKPLCPQEEFILRIERWLLARYAEMRPKTRREVVDSSLTLYCTMHPAAEEFEIAFIAPSQLVASANTTTCGPGYHVFVTSLLKDLAVEFNARWEEPSDDSGEFGDEAGYFFTGDEKRLNEEMATWLAALARIFFDGALDSDAGNIALCMPMNQRFEVKDPALTTLGPRSREWLRRTAQDGLGGTDFFAWWAPGFNAEYYLRRALAQMWVDVRWRPAINDSEETTLQNVADCLHKAYELDPGLPYPWAEWEQVLDLLGHHGEEAELVRARAQGEPTIGYRRRDVTVTLPGGWSIRVPGSFSEFQLDDENDFFAVDPPREIWFTAYSSNKASAGSAFRAMRKEVKKERPDYLIENDDYLSRAAVSRKRRDNGEEYLLLNSSNLGVGVRSVCTIVFSDPADKDWALETWRSLKPPSANES